MSPLPDRLRISIARRAAEASERDVKLAQELSGVSLPPPMRAVVDARAGNPGASWTEVAASVGMSVNAATSLWRRAMKRRPA
jgi:cell wall assembly regulator SMI1